MLRVLTKDGNESVCIGAFRFPDRKKPCIGVVKGNECTVYGSFTNDKAANDFMTELGTFIGAEFKSEVQEG